MIALLPLGTGIHRIIGVLEFQKLVPHFRIGVLIFLLAFVGSLIPNKRLSLIIQRVYMILVFALMIYWAVREIYFMNIDKWYWVT